MRILRRTAAVLVILWGGLINLFLLGSLFAPYRSPFIALNQAAPWLMLFSLLIFALTVALRGSRRLLLWLTPGVIVFVIGYLPAWLPRHSPKVAGTSLTAITYNVNLWGVTDADQMVAAMKGMDADIIGLEELPPHLQTRLSTDLHEQYPYQVGQGEERFDGLGLLSRFPIVESRVLLAMDWYPADYRIIGYLRAVLNVEGQQIVVYVVHSPLPVHYIDTYALAGYLQGIRYALFDYDDRFAIVHTTHIAALVAAETLPTLVLCDCNSTPRSHQYHIWDRVLNDAFGEQGWGLGLSHPVKPFPMLRVDYIWHTAEFTTVDAKLWPDAGSSDHYPVWARLVLRSE